MVKPCTDQSLGEAIFEFTDDSSVKDYGKLPFTTPFKGEDLCAMATQSFMDLQTLLKIVQVPYFGMTAIWIGLSFGANYLVTIMVQMVMQTIWKHLILIMMDI